MVISSLIAHFVVCFASGSAASNHDPALQFVDAAWRPRFVAMLENRGTQQLAQVNRILAIAAKPTATKAQLYEALLQAAAWPLFHRDAGLKGVSVVKSRWRALPKGESYEMDKGWLLTGDTDWGTVADLPTSLRIVRSAEEDPQARFSAALNLLGGGSDEQMLVAHAELLKLRDAFPKTACMRGELGISFIVQSKKDAQHKRENLRLAREEFLAFIKLVDGIEKPRSLARARRYVTQIDAELAKP